MVSGIVTTSATVGSQTDAQLAFLSYPEGSAYTRGSRALAVAEVAGSSFYRARFTASERDWFIYLPAARRQYTVPSSLPAGLTDRSSGSLEIQAIGLSGNKTLDDVVSFDSTNLDNLIEIINRYSVLPCASASSATGCVVQ